MPNIALVTPHITFGDAVCNDVFGMYAAFSKHGFNAGVFAADWTFQQDHCQVKPLSELSSFLKAPTDILVYHHSMGWRAGWELCAKLPCKKIMRYHNVTPPEFFAGWSDEYQSVCRSGREQTATIVAADCDLYLSASDYNMEELIAAGAPASKSASLPPFHHIDRLQTVEPDLEVIDRYRDGHAALLMVGSLFPNKGHAALLEIFATYFHEYNRYSRLFIVGKEAASLKDYSQHLRNLAVDLGVEDQVVFAGHVGESTLKSFYLMSDIFVTASEHEGFCVPLVESMSLGIPIVALGAAAIPETVAGMGIVWDAYDPRLFADSIDILIEDESLRKSVGQLGLQRYENELTTELIEQRLMNACGAIL